MAINWRRWGPIVFGVAVFVVFVGLAGVLFTVTWVRENLELEAATSASAETAFQEVRVRFAAKPPLVRMRNGTIEQHNPPEGTRRTTLGTLHILAFDPDEAQLLRLPVPFWLLRLKETPIEFGNYASGLNGIGVSLRVSDIERYGPGIVLDIEAADGGRVLVWAEQ